MTVTPVLRSEFPSLYRKLGLICQNRGSPISSIGTKREWRSTPSRCSCSLRRAVDRLPNDQQSLSLPFPKASRGSRWLRRSNHLIARQLHVTSGACVASTASNPSAFFSASLETYRWEPRKLALLRRIALTARLGRPRIEDLPAGCGSAACDVAHESRPRPCGTL